MASKTSRKPKAKRDRSGMDGAVMIQREQRSGGRVYAQSYRAMPGTFVWRYAAAEARTDDAARYEAGSTFAEMWEKAGIAQAGQSGITDAIGGGWAGLPDARCVALDEVRAVTRSIGKTTSARMVSYCVEGLTAGQIAAKWGVVPRDMAAILAIDLLALAVHYRLMSSRSH